MTFICGTHFKHKCRHQFTNYIDARRPIFTYKQDQGLPNDYVFCKPEFLQELKNCGHPVLHGEFTLVTHNSDINFTQGGCENVLKAFPIKRWYTQNLMYDHELIHPIPIGIANPKWSHGNQERFEAIASEKHEKDTLTYANFNIYTNIIERKYCLEQIGRTVEIQYPNAANLDDHDSFVNSTQEDYLRSIAKSFFTISPDGNGKDCHKTWESLYMKSIPIVTDSVFARKFKEMGVPLLIINDWKEFADLALSEDLYKELWGTFNPDNLADMFL